MRSCLVLCLTLTACGAGVSGLDAGAIEPTTDAGELDAGPGASDAGVPDAGRDPDDAGASSDAGPVDGGSEGDAGGPDAGVPDAGRAVDAGVSDAGAVCGRCAAYRAPANVGVVSNSAIKEISGLAASRLHPDVLYVHNDSGGQPVLYAIATSGASLAELRLVGAVSEDWEDLSAGPCPAGSCLYVADIGDNGNNRTTPYYVYRVAEPAAPPSGSLNVPWERFELQYPGGLRINAETLMVHPVSGDVYVVNKRTLGIKSAVYKAVAPLSTTAPNVMTRVADLAVPDGLDLPLTGGDIDPCGTAIVLRSYSAIYQFTGSGPFDSLFSGPFTRVPAPPLTLTADGESQGEAITWLPGGGYLTVSEGAGQTLHRVSCQ